MAEEESALRLGLRLASELETRQVPYALGGALAYAQAAIPRATLDVDVNVFVGADELAGVFAALRALSIPVDEAGAERRAANEGMFEVWAQRIRIDVFTASIPFSWEAARTRRAHVVDGVRAWFLSPEALAVFKLLFFRAKDLVDLERLVAVQGRALDGAYVRAQIVEMLGESDPRVIRWDALLAEHLPAA